MAEQVIAVFSDVEMGAGGPLDDFPHSRFLGELIVERCQGPWRDLEVDLVFDGDTFDLLKTPVEQRYPRHITADVALAKVSAVAAAHPDFFKAIRELQRSPVPRRVHFVVGNHDAELVFSEVQGLIHALCGFGEHISFPGFTLELGPVHLEHGHMADHLFRVDPERLFLEWKGEQVLSLAWASVGLLDAVIPMHPWFGFYDRVRPQARLLAMAPELKDLLLALGWTYWTSEFPREWWRERDPLLKLDWSVVYEVFRRMVTTDTDVSFDPTWLSETVERSPCELFITGHLHRSSSTLHGPRRLLTLGCFRDEFWLGEDGCTFTPILKPWLEVRVRDGRVVGLSQRELLGPDRPADHFPTSVAQGAARARELMVGLKRPPKLV